MTRDTVIDRLRQERTDDLRDRALEILAYESDGMSADDMRAVALAPFEIETERETDDDNE